MTDVGGVMDACKRQKKLHECGWRGRSPTSGLLEVVGTGALLGFAEALWKKSEEVVGEKF
jgi:hypothetical protein